MGLGANSGRYRRGARVGIGGGVSAFGWRDVGSLERLLRTPSVLHQQECGAVVVVESGTGPCMSWWRAEQCSSR